MNIGLLSILHNKVWDFRPDMAQTYANALKNAIELQLDNDIEKQHGYFLSKKGYQKDGKTVAANFEDKLYVGNIYRAENHLYWNDEELADDDQIINVVVVDGPITRDGGGCSYGSKDWRDQVMYANTIPQVVGHLFIINTPGGEAASRNDYEMMINDCREKGKPTVAFVDGMCASSGVNLACRCDRVIAMNPKDEFGCIGTMAAFWAIAHDTVDQDGYRYVELVGKDCPEKNAWYREAAKGEYDKLQEELDRDTEEFHNTVRENRPLVTDDMLSGKMFATQEAIPALVDEIGDMERAIECVFALANEEMQAARFVTAPQPSEKPDGDAQGDEPAEATHVEQPLNNENMTEQEMKAAAAEAAKAAEQEPVQGPTQEPAAEPAQETQEPAQETAEQPEVKEETPATEEAPCATPDPSPAGEESEQSGEEETPAEEQPAEEEEPSEEIPAEEALAEGTLAEEETIENSATEIDNMQDTLHNAESMIEQRDEEIESLKADIESKAAAIEANAKTIAEQKEAIDKLTKQNAALKAEVKELSEKPAPMVDENAGVPAGNATGEAPRVNQHQRITPDMTYEEIRALKKAAKK